MNIHIYIYMCMCACVCHIRVNVTYEGFNVLDYLKTILCDVETLRSNKTLSKNDLSFRTLLCPSSVVYWR